MEGIDLVAIPGVAVGGFGVGLGGAIICEQIKYAYIAKRDAAKSIARFSALEKLLGIYGKQMQPKEFVDYARSLDLIDSPDPVDDSE